MAPTRAQGRYAVVARLKAHADSGWHGCVTPPFSTVQSLWPVVPHAACDAIQRPHFAARSDGGITHIPGRPCRHDVFPVADECRDRQHGAVTHRSLRFAGVQIRQLRVAPWFSRSLKRPADRRFHLYVPTLKIRSVPIAGCCHK